MGEIEVVEIGEFGNNQASKLTDPIGSDVQVLEFTKGEEFLYVFVADFVVGEGELVEVSEFANVLEGLAGDLVATNVQALQVLQPHDSAHSVVVYLVVVDEQLLQLLEVVTDSVKPKVTDVVLTHNQRL